MTGGCPGGAGWGGGGSWERPRALGAPRGPAGRPEKRTRARGSRAPAPLPPPVERPADPGRGGPGRPPATPPPEDPGVVGGRGAADAQAPPSARLTEDRVGPPGVGRVVVEAAP